MVRDLPSFGGSKSAFWKRSRSVACSKSPQVGWAGSVNRSEWVMPYSCAHVLRPDDYQKHQDFLNVGVVRMKRPRIAGGGQSIGTQAAFSFKKAPNFVVKDRIRVCRSCLFLWTSKV